MNRLGTNKSIFTLFTRAIACSVVTIGIVSVHASPGLDQAMTQSFSAGAEQALDGRKIVDLGNGRFQFALDAATGTTPPTTLHDAIEWEYVGQATYSRSGRVDMAQGKKEFSILKDDGVTDLRTRLLRTEMEDEHGRLFRVKNINENKLHANQEQYDARVAVEFGAEDIDTQTDQRSFTDPEPQVGNKFSPLTWYRNDQNGDGVEDRFRWDSDDRNLASSPLTARQKKVVAYFYGDINSDAGLCTGVLIGSYWVLTAAHCAKTSSGTSWIYAEGAGEASRGKVCTRGNYYSGRDCANVIARYGNGSWGGTGDMGDDLIVMEIDQPLGLGNYMALSQAGNSTLKDHDAYNSGHPGLTPTGASNVLSCSLSTGDSYGGDTADNFAPCQTKMYWDHEEVNKTSSKIIGTKIDMSSGHSGGPIYYYPNGVSTNAAHYLTGIVSGHSQGLTKSYNGGPKIPYHRTWIQGVCGC